ncbi:FMN-dependent NADH-azoreductase [Bacillus cereus]|uniref:FMN dependent NADH:quinone oxidoreductase n=2 Tax=Bacillus cereus group TaxID=86661 RepID=A0A2C2FB48_BACCE|nr:MULTISPECIES: FMN-dependent NADH-azoreductase [Bacillus cereus group]ALQ67584.1 FMN-dependent NADH-azoreductase [Bacillus thuringiensis]OUA09674.1 FMN-dependent NADH-azoreductase [Bacillus thuringiensis serovar finitimus]PFC77353.1 FMN-dependent NADH-azoreductase [Bacillus cereus]PGW28301.1 FMN-dependent NADH-azoreductase [Bacillus cereus]
MGLFSSLFGKKEENTKVEGNKTMSKVLFVKANDRPAEQAISSKMYETFVNTYKEANPNTEITELDLFALDLPYYGNIAISGGYKRSQGMELTAEEEKAVATVDQYLNQFLEADKVVFAFPLWNFTVPAPLITYISYLSQAGKTFKYTANGPEGLAGGKKVVVLGARGSDYSSEQMAPMEMAVNYVTTVLGFWGITNPETVVIEGHNQYPDRSQQIVEEGLENVKKVAAKF